MCFLSDESGNTLRLKFVYCYSHASLRVEAFLIGWQTAIVPLPKLLIPNLNRFTFSFSAGLSRLWFHERFLPVQPCNLVVFATITATRCCFLSLSTLVSCR